jgi:hypothetical protein
MCWADSCAGVELVRADIDAGSAVDGGGMAGELAQWSLLAVHPADGFAPGPMNDASPNNDSVADVE